MPFRLRAATRPPRLAPLVGRASPQGSHNFGGVGKGVDMPNQSASPTSSATMSPLGVKLGSTAPFKHEIPTSYGPNRSYI